MSADPIPTSNRTRRVLAEGAIGLALPLAPVAVLALDAARVTGFGADQAISFAQASRHLHELTFPTRGLINSHGFWNPNGLVLLASSLLAVARGPWAFSVLLSLGQAAAVLACFRWLTAEPSGRRSWILYLAGPPLLVWTPVLSHTSVELWAQYVARTLLCLLLALILSTSSLPSIRRDLALGFLIVFAPAVHLGLVVVVPVALLPLLLSERRARISFPGLAAGAAAASALSFVPWIASGAATIPRKLAELDATRCWAAVLGAVIELPRLLTAGDEGWFDPARDKILGAPAEGMLQAFADVRSGVALVVLAIGALLLLAKRQQGRAGVEAFLLVLLLVYSWEATGSGIGQRPSFGAMALQPLYLGIAVSTYRILRSVEDRLLDSGRRLGIALMRGGVIVGVLWMGALWVRGTREIVRDVRRNVAFGPSDIPLEEKLEALEALDRAARGRPTATVAYRNASFGPTFPFVAIYGVQEGAPPRDYRAGSFFEAVLNARSRTRYTFVDGGSVADYSLTHPPGSTWAQDGPCRRIWSGRRLVLRQCAAIEPPSGPAGLPAGGSDTAAPGGR